jgi:pyruvate dehydrogenase complex dehydrogenase (E1) component
MFLRNKYGLKKPEDFIVFEGHGYPLMMHSQFLEGLKCESQTENNRRQGVRACSLACSTIEGQRGVLELRDGTMKK